MAYLHIAQRCRDDGHHPLCSCVETLLGAMPAWGTRIHCHKRVKLHSEYCRSRRVHCCCLYCLPGWHQWCSPRETLHYWAQLQVRRWHIGWAVAHSRRFEPSHTIEIAQSLIPISALVWSLRSPTEAVKSGHDDNAEDAECCRDPREVCNPASYIHLPRLTPPRHIVTSDDVDLHSDVAVGCQFIP